MNQETDKRGNARTPCNENILFALDVDEVAGAEGRSADITATVIDISATGMGLATEIMLKKGQSILFPTDQPNWQLPTSGTIVWSYRRGDGCRAGLEFVL